MLTSTNYLNGQESRANGQGKNDRILFDSPHPPRDICMMHGHPRRSFSLADTQRIGFTLRLPVPTILFCLGSTACRIGAGVVNRFHAEWQRPGLPAGFDYLLTDAAPPRPGMDSDHFLQLDGGVNGAGTDPNEGFKLFHSPENHRTARQALNRKVVGASSPDPQLPVGKLPRETVDFWVVATSGGTGGGALHSAIGLVNAVAQERNIREPHVHAVLLGPDMPLRDRSRQVTEEQKQLVRATAAHNLVKLIADFAADATLLEPTPDGGSFAIQASRRVWTITVADQGNGYADCSTTDAFVKLLANVLFVRLFTQAGVYVADRFPDFDRIGPTGRGGQ